MADRRRGYIFVGIQFALLIALVGLPQGNIWPVDQFLGSFAAAMIVAGLIVVLLGLMGLGRSLTATPVPKKDASLQTTGIYALVRHPIYSGLLLLALGAVVGGGSLWKAGIFLVLILVLILKARFEERLLMEKYPNYAVYAGKVGRFIPGIGKFK